MKTKTRINDLQTLLDRNAATAAAVAARKALATVANFLTDQDALAAEAGHVARVNAEQQAQEARFKKIPAARRDLATGTLETAQTFGKVASHLGGLYSGETTYRTRWGTRADASTTTSKGDQYSRSCTYPKTDACHTVVLDPAGVLRLHDRQDIARESAQDGLRLIALYPDDSAVWIRTKGKQITAERGWIAYHTSGEIYHSTKSHDDAARGLNLKVLQTEKAQIRHREARKQDRRARLIARLCPGINATIDDARKIGLCMPGIRQFQERHGIADTATLPELLKTGNPDAIRLALTIARSA